MLEEVKKPIKNSVFQFGKKMIEYALKMILFFQKHLVTEKSAIQSFRITRIWNRFAHPYEFSKIVLNRMG